MKKRFQNPFQDLSRFEWGLWLLSMAVILISSCFSGAEGVLSGIASLIGVTALIFVAKGYVLGQVLTIVFAVFYGVVSYFFCYYGEMITYLCMTAPVALAAVISWLRHPYEDSKEVEVAHLSKGKFWLLVLADIAVTILFYFILRALHTPNLIISSVSVTTSFLASALTVFRSPWYAMAYAANDIVLIILWVLASMVSIAYLPMFFCFIMFLINDLYGFYNWRRMRKRQSM